MTTEPQAPGGVKWVGIPPSADGKYSLKTLIDAIATQHPDLPTPTHEQLLDNMRSKGFVNPDGSVNRDAPIPAGQPSIPTVTYDTSGRNTSNLKTVETPTGEDSGFYAIINSMKGQMPGIKPPTVAELREIARSLGLAPPYGDFDLAAVLEAWGKKNGHKLSLGVKKG